MSEYDPEEAAEAAYEEASQLVASMYEAAGELDVDLADSHWTQVAAHIHELLGLVEDSERVCAELLGLREPAQESPEDAPGEIRLPVFTPVDATLVPEDVAEGDELEPWEIAKVALGDAADHLRELARIAVDEAEDALTAARDGKRHIAKTRVRRARFAAEQCKKDYAVWEQMLNQVGDLTGSYPAVAGIAIEATEAAIRDHEIERELQDIVEDERPNLDDSGDGRDD